MPNAERIDVTSYRVRSFIDDGFIKIENAFSTHLADQCRDELWADIGLSPYEPENWTQPVIRVGSKTSLRHRSLKPPTRRSCTKPMTNSRVIVAGSRPKRSELFRSAFPHRNPRVMTAGMWT